MREDRQTSEALLDSPLDGGYRIVGLLGHGGMGTVYEAVKLPLNNRVAVKVMARELAADTDAMIRFRREAEVTSSLGHPHIVQVFDFGSTPGGEPFLVMELLRGEDLLDRMRRTDRLSARETLHIVKQVASALAAAHARDIIHRDLKPANIFVLDVPGETDFIKVLDFGISKVRSGPLKLTHNTTRIGTPSYMAPEQALGHLDAIDGRTDQWALACIAWEALSGREPFVGEDNNSVLFQVVNTEPAPLMAKGLELRPAIEKALRRALSKNRDRRFRTVTEFALALESAVLGTTNETASISSVDAWVEAAPAKQGSAASQAATLRLAPTASSASLPETTGTAGRSSCADSSIGNRGRPSTTCSQATGEMDKTWSRRCSSRLKRVWGTVGGVALALLVGGLVLSHRPYSLFQPAAQPATPSTPPEPSQPPPAQDQHSPPAADPVAPKAAPEPAARPDQAKSPDSQARSAAKPRPAKRYRPSIKNESRDETKSPARPRSDTNLIREL